MSNSGDDVAFDSPQEHEEEYHGKKHRTIFSSEQKNALEKLFLINPFPDKKQREELAASIGVNNPKSVDYWFGHRRAKNRQHMKPQDDHYPSRVPTSRHHREREERSYRHRESLRKVPDDYYSRGSDEEYSHYNEDEYPSHSYSKAPQLDQLVSASKKRKVDAFERPENQSLEELWVACLLNHFYVDARQ